MSTARGYTLLDLIGKYRWHDVEASLALPNAEATPAAAPAGFRIAARYGRLRGAGPLCAALLGSLIVHGIVLAWAATVSLRLPALSAPIRVTLINPAPPPPPPGAAVAVPAPVEIAKAEPRSRAKKVVHKTERLRVAHKTHPAHRRKAKPAVPPETAPEIASAAKQAGEPDGVKGGVPGGVTGGKVGGIVGGHGDQLWQADQVATPPVAISRPLPNYPPLARARGIEGLVVLEAIIDRQGHVEQDGLKVLQSVPALDAAALSAFRLWRFRPARGHDGEPVRVVLRVPIRFQLR